MRPVRRHDLAPRVDLLPLIDVVFLLLTFFLFAIVVRPEMLGLSFTMLPLTGPDAARPTMANVLTIDVEGQMTLGGQPVTIDDLPPLLEVLGRAEPQIPLYVVLEEADPDRPGQIDRLPLWIRVGTIARQAGLQAVQVSGPAGAARQLRDPAP